MHEASLALSLVELIEDTVRREGAARAVSATVELGALSHVEPGALLFSFTSAASGGAASGATLRVVRPDGRAACMRCGGEVTVSQRGDPCPQCGSHQLLVTAGDQMRLVEVEVV